MFKGRFKAAELGNDTLVDELPRMSFEYIECVFDVLELFAVNIILPKTLRSSKLYLLDTLPDESSFLITQNEIENSGGS